MYIAINSRSEVDIGRRVFVDYGGGTGILSMLAMEMGFGAVLYVDIYDVSCRDAELVAEGIGVKADKYICGDIDALCGYVSDSGVFVDVLVSYDVIEHIYDIESFFSKTSMLNTEGLVVVSASSANAYNPFIRRKRMSSHRETEDHNRPNEWGIRSATLCGVMWISGEKSFPVSFHIFREMFLRAWLGILVDCAKKISKNACSSMLNSEISRIV